MPITTCHTDNDISDDFVQTIPSKSLMEAVIEANSHKGNTEGRWWVCWIRVPPVWPLSYFQKHLKPRYLYRVNLAFEGTNESQIINMPSKGDNDEGSITPLVSSQVATAYLMGVTGGYDRLLQWREKKD